MTHLEFALARLAVRTGLNLNYVFDPVHTWRLGQPFTLRKLIAKGGAGQ